MRWSKLLVRDDIDVPTAVAVIQAYYCLPMASKGRKERAFTLFHDNTKEDYTCVDHHEIGRKLYNKYFKNKKQVMVYCHQANSILAKARTDVRRKESTIRRLRRFSKEFHDVTYWFSIVSWWALEAWQRDCEETLNNLIHKHHLEKEMEDIFGSVLKPWKKTAIYEIQQSKDTKKMMKRYEFLRSWCPIWYRPLTKEWFHEMQKNTTGNKKRYTLQELIMKLKPNRQERLYIEMAPYMTFFKDYRDDVRRKFAYHWNPLFEEIAKALNTNYFNLGYFSLDEINDMLESGTFDKETCERRRKKRMIITVRDDVVIYDRNIPKRYLSIVKKVEHSSQGMTIKGLVAQKGHAVGRVKVVRSHHDLKRIEKGDILVANTTYPDYIPALQKAAAFVTNEGGIASHAAIIARELKVPCIVGTKIATKVLNDGDMVEVDADKGIVRKIR